MSEQVLVLDRAQTGAALEPGRVGAAAARALTAIARGEVSSPPRIAARTPNGLLGAMPGHVPGLGLAAKLITVFADPDRPGRSTHQGVVALFDEDDGRLLALMDAEPLTAVRTAVTATLALRALARPGSSRVAVIGTGTQAAAQLAQLNRIARFGQLGRPDRPVEAGAPAHGPLAVGVAGRDPASVRRLADRYGVTPAVSIEAAVRAADVVLCCTGAREPVVRREWLSPGTHVSSVGGSDGAELDAQTIRDALLFAEWPGAVTAPPPAGAHELQGLPADGVTLLGAVLAGDSPGRSEPGQLTVFKSTGHAALDVAAASVVHAVARERGLGTTLDWSGAEPQEPGGSRAGARPAGPYSPR